jgi:hypothetical protein
LSAPEYSLGFRSPGDKNTWYEVAVLNKRPDYEWKRYDFKLLVTSLQIPWTPHDVDIILPRHWSYIYKTGVDFRDIPRYRADFATSTDQRRMSIFATFTKSRNWRWRPRGRMNNCYVSDPGNRPVLALALTYLSYRFGNSISPLLISIFFAYIRDWRLYFKKPVK